MDKVLSVLALGAVLGFPAWAGDDDDLAPLTPVKPKPKPAPAAHPKPAAPRKTTAPVARPASGDDDLAPLTPVVARGELGVRLLGGVQGATLLVDGKEVAALPAGRQSLPTGEHTVTVKRLGFAPYTRRLVLGASKAVDLDVRLVPTSAVLSVRCDVPDARVTVNGRKVGQTPLLELEVAPGLLDVVVSHEGYLEEHQRVAASAGRDYPVTLHLTASAPPVAADAPVERSLTPLPSLAPGPVAVSEASVASTPLVQRWYFWAGVAVVVVAAAAGTAAAVTAAQAPRQRSPTEVCGGTCDGCVGLACSVARPGFNF
jgi:PEGA domain